MLRTLLSKKMLILAAVLLCGSFVFLNAQDAEEKEESLNIPKDTLTELKTYFAPKKPVKTEEDLRKIALEQMDYIIDTGKKLEEKYPEAANLSLLRGIMLNAMNISLQFNPDSDIEKERVDLSRRILESKAPAKLQADAEYFVLKVDLKDDDGNYVTAADKKLQEYVKKYSDTPAQPYAIMYAAMIATDMGDEKLATAWADKLEENFSDNKDIRRYLMSIGRGPVFTAELKKVDGSELKLPDDLKGKIIVVDFWASWCPPCRAAMPKLKKLYDKYKDQGVEFVGISLDSKKSDLTKYIDKQNLPWIQTYSGKKWNDPTAKKYNVNSIPRMMVLSEDGRILSDNAHGKLEEILKQQTAEKTASADE